MKTEEYHKMHAMEKTYWWFQGRRRVILTVLNDVVAAYRRGRMGETGEPRMLDVGCGTGMLLEDLHSMGSAVGLDFSPVALNYCRERNLHDLGRADVRNLPVRGSSIDIVTALDLVEHVIDDAGLLGEFHRVLRPGGAVVLTVPAHKSLWSNHDIALQHFRRYEKREFESLVRAAGLKPVKYTYMMSAIYYPAALFRLIKRLVVKEGAEARTDEFMLPGFLNSGLLGLVKAEARFLRSHNLPFGLSLLCIAEKPR